MQTGIILAAALVVPLLLTGFGASAADDADAKALELVLRTFLAGTEQKAVHEAFWADDLIYTSSSGSRHGKATIMAGFNNQPNASTPELRYTAEDVTTRVLTDTAVVTFRLVAEENGVRVSEYFNTGVFRREGETWKAFTWQATRIPDPA